MNHRGEFLGRRRGLPTDLFGDVLHGGIGDGFGRQNVEFAQQPPHPITGLGAHRQPILNPFGFEPHFLDAVLGRDGVVGAELGVCEWVLGCWGRGRRGKRGN